ncbi:hypothetical protein [uncultured Tenacibaculum sp.]|uniref:hypothetical protein n=1 Tax=uncultured Tenacibaculum sp. TaxID=174713 RepID=UPI002612EE80|nr:hypothetical protein [uncultured Tenacibaculum sp.]
MKFNPKTFAEKIQSKYIDYDTQLGEVFCHIFDRNKNKSDYENFAFEVKNFDFFDSNKLDKEALIELKPDYAKLAIISSIIKETKYDTHFIDWEQGEKYSNEFLSEFVKIEKIYTNAGFYGDYNLNHKINKNELMMNGWSRFSSYYWYDYGFIIISEKKIGILWFGDES